MITLFFEFTGGRDPESLFSLVRQAKLIQHPDVWRFSKDYESDLSSDEEDEYDEEF